MRTIIELTPEQVAGLERYTKRHRVSRAAAVREAVERLLERETASDDAFEQAFGMWKDRGIDADTYLSELRKEWDREWDK